MIQQSLDNALQRAGIGREVVTVITQVCVDPDDPAMRSPTKFIGHAIETDVAEELRQMGEAIAPDGQKRLRRVVPSPAPESIHELEIIRHLVDRGTIVIACGGGGIPIYRDPKLGLEGVDAVVDKDLAAAVLARDIGASLLLILTDVDAVYADWGTPQQRPLRRVSVETAMALDAGGAFGEGSMAPKVRAAIDYVRHTAGCAIITGLDYGQEAVRGRAGTTIVP